MSTQRTPQNGDMTLVYALLVALPFAFAVCVWYFEHESVSYNLLKWSWTHLGWIDLPFMPDSLRALRAHIATLARSPAMVSFEQLVSVVNQAGTYFVWLPALISVAGAWMAVNHRANKTRRKITAETLPHIMARHCPAIIPALYYGDKDTLLLNVDPHEHRSALTPDEWVAQHGVLVAGGLDRSRCAALLAVDLGTHLTSLEELTPIEKAMFAVFALRVFEGRGDGDPAQALLDSLNRSCHHHTFQGKKGYPNLGLATEYFQRLSGHPDAAAWLERHPYSRTLLYALHKAAMTCGKLPSSHFRWLKGMDRSLWYALNTTGRKKPFMESAAVFTQAGWEVFAFDRGYKLTEPSLEDAVDALEGYLVKVGLVAARPHSQEHPSTDLVRTNPAPSPSLDGFAA